MMSTPKLPHSTSADRSTKVMGLALRDVNESLAGSLGIAEGTTEYMNMTSSVSDTVENFIGDGSAISTKLTEELYKLTSEVRSARMADSLSRRTRVRPPCPGVAGAGTMDDRRQPGGATIVATAGGGRAARGARPLIECRHFLPLSINDAVRACAAARAGPRSSS